MSTNESKTEMMSQGVMGTGDDTRIFPDVAACIDCGGCVVACNRTWDMPRDEQRISISTMLEGEEGAEGLNASPSQAIGQGENPGETSVPMQCYHCENAPCVSVCPVDALVKKDDGFVDVRDDVCIGCQYCLSACPFGAPQFPGSNDGSAEIFGTGGTMDKCTMCQDRQEVGKGPACAEECATDAILVGTTEQIADELDKRDSGTFFNDDAMEIVFGADDAEAFGV
ncbi:MULTISPECIES: 4Fe-4S dicluster domain-containing protein [Halolamina]|uniref:Formate dehydrogenase iron-sulfur subunit n=1 Tax=Halolamina pelagica TaxID=699431 RepID=A0A1I5NT99_9EURY|nr:MULTISPECIES: 4Fe-4S dicluster domain-containing protein [Halolamina]NHX36448.1 4Fe-4S dicluster domain-containing protein [Halolamina sp. R1-12]SFP24526.1 formate dehydrogenase iron-sulfur subunit [Halolamina pelagica]